MISNDSMSIRWYVYDNDCNKNVAKINNFLFPRDIDKFPNESKPNKINTALRMFVCFSFFANICHNHLDLPMFTTGAN